MTDTKSISILDNFLSIYNIKNKNTDYISVSQFENMLNTYSLRNRYPPDFAIMSAENRYIKCINIDSLRLSIRAKLYEEYFKKLIDIYDIYFVDKTTFIIDLSDGCQNRDFLFDLDKICLSTSVPNKNTIASLPISDPHYLHGNYKHYYDGSIELSQEIWESKKDSFLHRSSIRPTLRPDAREGSQWITPRLDFCKKYSNITDIDIGVVEIENPTGWVKDYQPYFKNKMTRLEMSTYRYNILISGIGGNFEALIWMLLSGSTILRLCPDNKDLLLENRPHWLLWFDVLLEPYVHYIPFTMDNFLDITNWCKYNMDECKNIALNAKTQYNVIISMWDEYNAQVLRMISSI